MRALGVVRLKGEEPAWLKLDFIERTHDVNTNDPLELRREIERLRLEKSDLAAQLEKSQTLLRTQIDISKEKETIHDTEIHQAKIKLKSANTRVEELVKLADFRNKTNGFLQSGMENGDKEYDDNVSEFSEMTENELQAGENFLDVYVGNGDLDDVNNYIFVRYQY